MKNQALFSSKDKSKKFKKLKCRLLQFLLGALRVSICQVPQRCLKLLVFKLLILGQANGTWLMYEKP